MATGIEQGKNVEAFNAHSTFHARTIFGCSLKGMLTTDPGVDWFRNRSNGHPGVTHRISQTEGKRRTRKNSLVLG